MVSGPKPMYNPPLQHGKIQSFKSIFPIKALMIPMEILLLEDFNVLWQPASSLQLLEAELDPLLLL
jgi:hypothetical protein